MPPLLNISSILIPTLPGIIVGLTVALLIDYIKRKTQLSNVLANRITSINQDDHLIVFRLVLMNNGEYAAKSIEMQIDSILEGNDEREFIPSPLAWTHKDPKIPQRDIFPNQFVYLDLLNYKEYPDIGEIKLTVNTPNLVGIPDMIELNAGTTTLNLISFQENGQSRRFKIHIYWEGKHPFEKYEPIVTIDPKT